MIFYDASGCDKKPGYAETEPHPPGQRLKKKSQSSTMEESQR